MRRAQFALLALVLAVGCADPLDIRVTENYRAEWSSFTTSGDTPGHGDSIRIIYVNDTAKLYSGGTYPEGSVLVKEVYENNNGRPGTLQVIEVMHRVGPLMPGQYYEQRLGWVFGSTDAPNGEERDDTDFCWRRCHLNAPVAGAWFNYGALQ